MALAAQDSGGQSNMAATAQSGRRVAAATVQGGGLGPGPSEVPTIPTHTADKLQPCVVASGSATIVTEPAACLSVQLADQSSAESHPPVLDESAGVDHLAQLVNELAEAKAHVQVLQTQFQDAAALNKRLEALAKMHKHCSLAGLGVRG